MSIRASHRELFWIVYPDRREIEVSTAPDTHRILRLDGGPVLPGFSVKVADLFATVKLQDDAKNE